MAPLRTELVHQVAAALAVGVGFDAILWYFIWLCWFDRTRSSILPDASRYPSKAFCFIGLLFCLTEFLWLFDGINAPFECRPWKLEGGGGGGRKSRPMWSEHAWNLKVRCQKSQWRGGICSERRCYTGVEYQMFKSLSGILKCD